MLPHTPRSLSQPASQPYYLGSEIGRAQVVLQYYLGSSDLRAQVVWLAGRLAEAAGRVGKHGSIHIKNPCEYITSLLSARYCCLTKAT